MDALSKINRAVATLPSVESVHILRDPPKSIHTRKKERVEFGDVSGDFLRSNPDRISEYVQMYARGVNPMVSVDYSNSGNGANTTSLQGGEASLPYKVNRDGAFRPPMIRPIEDELAWSRMKRGWTSVQARPGIDNGNYFDADGQQRRIDKDMIRASVHPSATFEIGLSPHQYQGNMVLDDITQSVLDSMIKKNKGAEGRVIAQGLPTATGMGSVANTIAVTDIASQNVQNYIQDRPLGQMLTNLSVPQEVQQDIQEVTKGVNRDKKWMVYQTNPSKADSFIEDREARVEYGLRQSKEPIRAGALAGRALDSHCGDRDEITDLQHFTGRNTKLVPHTNYTTPQSSTILYVDHKDRQDMRDNFLDSPSMAPINDGRPIVSAFTLPTKGLEKSDWVTDPTYTFKRQPLHMGGFNNMGMVSNFSRGN